MLNNSFESVNLSSLQCSWYLTNAQFISAVNNWDYPTQGSTDLYHMSLSTTCFSHPLSTNSAAVGQQLPRTGSAMTNIVTYGSGGCTPYREYVQGELSSTLTVGVTYNISVFVSLADYSSKGTNNIGFKFTTVRQSTGSMCVWQTTPDVNYTGTPIMDKEGWTELTFQYTPTTANLRYFSIGNFITDTGTTTISSASGSLNTIRYFIDDVSISPATTPTCNLIVSAGGNQTIDCENTNVTLNGSASNGTPPYSYSWIPATGLSDATIANPIASPTSTTTYTLTVTDALSCTQTSSVIVSSVVNLEPTFNQVAPICEGDILNTLPTTSTNGVSGTWQPAINNTATTTYTFTPNTGVCANTASMTIVVNQKTTPTFNQVAPICEGDNLNALPTTSTNGLAGTWQPAMNNMATTTYTFTPNTGVCANTASMTIVVNQKTTPTFNQVTPICEGDNLNALPTTSTNGVSGTWQPAMNNMATTTYTFTPNTGVCANTASMTIVVNQKVMPTFNQVAPICYNENFDLPILSTNSISGVWFPSPNITTTTNYIFTPNTGECALATNMEVVVLDDFDFEIDNECLDENYILSFSVVTNSFDAETSTYDWEYNNQSIGINNTLNLTSYIHSTSVFEELPLTIKLTITNSDGCSKTKNYVVDNMFCGIQKGISPNNDGKNEFFDLRLLDVKKLSIFNRYGTKVYQKNNYYNQWTGQSDSGNKLPDSVYYYVIEFNNDNETKVGWIYINSSN
ncbi:MAG TPA: gliding motility-associated C-terminal domain-containing protein [Flavobacterium lutivivi]|nr:gliding motility-associated C-terminal domain-containing protein [Flavobacterium lutivivi]